MGNNMNKITVTTEDNKVLEINVLLMFELPEFKKKYVLYSLESDSNNEDVTMFISSINTRTNEIKEINNSEIDVVKNVYLELKKELLKEENN